MVVHYYRGKYDHIIQRGLRGAQLHRQGRPATRDPRKGPPVQLNGAIQHFPGQETKISNSR